jgi:hypothetical protein
MKQIIFLLGIIIALQLLWIANQSSTQSESFDSLLRQTNFKSQNVINEYTDLCSLYDRKGFYPQSQGECPDSSFTYVANVAANVPGSNNHAPGCVQLKESPYCSIQPDGTYRPNFVKLLYRVSP